MAHLSQHDLERYHLGMIKNRAELARTEEHYLCCPRCAGLAEEAADYVDAIRVAATFFSESVSFGGRVAKARGT